MTLGSLKREELKEGIKVSHRKKGIGKIASLTATTYWGPEVCVEWEDKSSMRFLFAWEQDKNQFEIVG